jgi:hypothetical protein
VLSLLKAGSLHYWLILRQPRPILPVVDDANDDDASPPSPSETTPLLDRNAAATTTLSDDAPVHPTPLETLLALHSSLLLHFHAHWMHLQSLPPEAFSVGQRPTVMDFERTVFVAWKAEVARWLERGRLGGWVDDRGWTDDIEAREVCRSQVSTEERTP